MPCASCGLRLLIRGSRIASLLSMCFTLALNAAPGDKQPPLTRVDAIQQLTSAEAARAQPVQIRGVVTYVDEQTGELFVQDSTAGIFVDLRESESDQPLRALQVIELQGLTGAGTFSPCVTQARIRVVGQGSYPAPERPSLEQLMGGKSDGHWAEVHGIVRSGDVKQGRLLLHVNLAGGEVVAFLKDYPRDWFTTLIDSQVRIQGAVSQIHNYRRQSIGATLMVPSGSLSVEQPAPANPFSLPLSPVNFVRSYDERSRLQHRVRVRAEVVAVDPGHRLYIQDAMGSLEVDGRPACKAKAGEMIDVIGFPGSVAARPALVDARCRRAEGAGTLAAIPLTAKQILTPESDADIAPESLAEGFAEGTLYDMRLVRIEGTLLQSSRGPQGYMLLLDSEGKQFVSRLPSSQGNLVTTPETGSRLAVTGVCLINYDQYRRAESFRLLLRAPVDVAVIQPAPWWNLENAMRLLSVMAVILLGAIFWVARQSLQLRRANATLRRLSFEDGLTGIANRRKFDAVLKTVLKRAYRTSRPVSLLMLDIDYFKALNDHYGHQWGDECLVRVAHALRSIPIRRTDLVARYGGEEFAVILTGTDAQGAVATAERIRLAVAELAIPHEVSPFDHVSISAGVSTIWPDRETSCGSLIALADSALYLSKTSGRNRISSAPLHPQLTH